MVKPSLRLLVTCLATTLCGGYHAGWQLGMPNAATKTLQAFFNESYTSNYGQGLDDKQMRLIWAVYSGSPMLTAAIGGLTSSFFVNKMGRKPGLYICGFASILVMIPALISKYVNMFELLFLSRAVHGALLGYGTVVQTTYIIEICPQSLRGYRFLFGAMSCLVGITIRTSYLLATICSTESLLGTPDLWPILWAIEIAVTVLFLFNVFLSRESPFYLVDKQQFDEAKKSIQLYHGPKADADAFISQIQRALEMQKKALSIPMVLFTTPVIRKAAVISSACSFLAAWSGVAVIQSFSSILLEESGFSEVASSNLTIIVGLGGVFGTVLLIVIIERFNRRTILLTSAGLVVALNIVMWAILWANHIYKSLVLAWLFLGAQFLFITSFCSGIGPMNMWMASELVTPNARGANQAIATALQFVGFFTAAVAFLPLSGLIDQHAFWMFVVATSGSMLIYYYLPEARNKSPEEIFNELKNGRKKKDMEMQGIAGALSLSAKRVKNMTQMIGGFPGEKISAYEATIPAF